jgi:sporulation protein YlmC with PRC-barrel domain
MATSIAGDIGIDAASTRDQQGQSGAAGAERTQIDVDQAAPQITVRDTAPEPEVTIKKPEPEVNVTMPEPKVDVEQAPPQVEVDRAEPEVGVRQGEPIVGVEQPAPQVEVDQARPNVEVSRAQPQVEVDTAEPQVRVQRDEAAAQLAEGKAAEEEVAAVAGAEGGDAGAAGTVPDNPLYLLTADELVGRTVTGAAGEEIGDIEDIVIGRDDQKLYAVLSVGGFLGIGARDVAVPFESLIIGEDDRLMLEGMTKEELTSLSAYDRTTYVSVERDVLLRESL